MSFWLTLGATGEARAVGFTHNNQLKRVARCNHLFGKTFPECSRFFSSYGLGSSSEFLYVLYVLSRGGTIYFPGASLIETLQTFDVYKVQGLIASPGNLSDFLSFYDDNPDFRSSFGVIPSAGSPLPRSLSERVRSRMGSNLVRVRHNRNFDDLLCTGPRPSMRALPGISRRAFRFAPSMNRGQSWGQVTRDRCRCKRRSM